MVYVAWRLPREDPHCFGICEGATRANEMIKLEIINVRTASEPARRSVIELCRQICPPRIAEQAVEIKVYASAIYKTDLSIQLRWRSEREPPDKSPFGFEISYALCDFGLVNHSVWLEQSGG